MAYQGFNNGIPMDYQAKSSQNPNMMYAVHRTGANAGIDYYQGGKQIGQDEYNRRMNPVSSAPSTAPSGVTSMSTAKYGVADTGRASDAMAALADVNKQRYIDRATADAKTQQNAMMGAASRRAAQMGKKFSNSPESIVQAAANVAAAATRAGDTAEDMRYQRQAQLAGMRNQEQGQLDSRRNAINAFNENVRQYNTSLANQQQQFGVTSGLQSQSLAQQQAQFNDRLNAEQLASKNATIAYQNQMNQAQNNTTNSNNSNDPYGVYRSNVKNSYGNSSRRSASSIGSTYKLSDY